MNFEELSDELARQIPNASKGDVKQFITNQAAKTLFYRMLIDLLITVEDKRTPEVILTEARFLAKLINMRSEEKPMASTQSSIKI